MSSPLLAALRLRATVLRRRYGSPLEAVLLAGLTWLAYALGEELGERFPQDGAALAALGTCAFAAAGLWLGGAAAHALYGATELVILTSNGLRLRDIVLLRGAELGVLAMVLALPLAGCQAGIVQARGADPSAWLALAWLGGAAALTGAGCCAAWLSGRVRGGARLLGLVGLVALGGLVAASQHPAGAALLGGAAAPGTLWRAAARGSARAAGAIAAGGAVWAALGLALAAVGHGAARDRAAVRSTASRQTLWRLLALPTRPLGLAAGGLLRRDVAILLRGGFKRGLLLVIALPLALLVLRQIVTDPSLKLKPWQVQWAGLLVSGILASAAGYLWGVDYPRARDGQRVIERSQPLRGGQVLLSRWAPAAAYALALALGAALLITLAPKPPSAGGFLLAACLQALAVTHDAAAFGMGAESSAAVDQAAGFPFRSGILVLVLSFALIWSPLGILIYPVLGYVHAAQAAVRRWEHAEVVPLAREGGA